jgi:hypothetical protein
MCDAVDIVFAGVFFRLPVSHGTSFITKYAQEYACHNTVFEILAPRPPHICPPIFFILTLTHEIVNTAIKPFGTLPNIPASHFAPNILQ